MIVSRWACVGWILAGWEEEGKGWGAAGLLCTLSTFPSAPRSSPDLGVLSLQVVSKIRCCISLLSPSPHICTHTHMHARMSTVKATCILILISTQGWWELLEDPGERECLLGLEWEPNIHYITALHVCFLAPVVGWENRGSERWSKLPKPIQLVSQNGDEAVNLTEVQMSVWPWTRVFTSLSLSFPSRKVGRAIVMSSSQECCKALRSKGSRSSSTDLMGSL